MEEPRQVLKENFTSGGLEQNRQFESRAQLEFGLRQGDTGNLAEALAKFFTQAWVIERFPVPHGQQGLDHPPLREHPNEDLSGLVAFGETYWVKSQPLSSSPKSPMILTATSLRSLVLPADHHSRVHGRLDQGPDLLRCMLLRGQVTQDHGRADGRAVLVADR